MMMSFICSFRNNNYPENPAPESTLIRGSPDGTVEPGRYRQETLDLAA
jgi:hypothetical protein